MRVCLGAGPGVLCESSVVGQVNSSVIGRLIVGNTVGFFLLSLCLSIFWISFFSFSLLGLLLISHFFFRTTHTRFLFPPRAHAGGQIWLIHLTEGPPLPLGPLEHTEEARQEAEECALASDALALWL